MDEELDRLMDTLLREVVAGEEPPNLARRILGKVDAERKQRVTRIYWLTSAGIAATVLIGILIWQLTAAPKAPDVAKNVAPPVPPPEKTDKKDTPPEVAPEFANLGRGTLIETKDKSQKYQVGGYCKLEAAPNSALISEGKDKAEQVFLKRGHVDCEVDKSVGTFAVRTEAGIVSVTGTKFGVQSLGEGAEKSEYGRSTEVTVKEGSVMVAGVESNVHVGLTAGETGGVMIGMVTRVGDNGVDIRTVGDKEPRRYLPVIHDNHFDPAMLASLKELRQGDRVQLSWKLQEHRRVMKLKVLQRHEDREKAEHDHGKAEGRVIEKDPNNEWIRIQVESSNEKYTPRWNNDTKSLDREMRARIGELKSGDIVTFEWIVEEHRRLTKIEKSK
jgi:hypothetical protein